MSDLPPGWTEAPLSGIAAIIAGQAPPGISYNTDGDGLPLFQGKTDFGDLYLDQPRLWTTTPSKVAEREDVLLSVRAPVGPTNLATARCAIGRGLAAIRGNEGVSQKYLLYALRASEHRLREHATGTTFAAITSGVIRDHRIPLAPTAEQERIVAAVEEQFSRLDAGVAALRRAQGQLKRMRAAVLQVAVAGHLVPSVERCWDRRPLPKLGTVDRGRSRHRPRNAPELYGGPYPFIQTGDVASAMPWITSYSQTYNEKGLAQSRLWPSGTLCITIAANIAKTGILTFDACFPDSVVGFVAEDGPTAIRWIEMIVRHMQGRLEQLAPATAQKNINLAVLRALEIPYPDLEYQAEVVGEYDRQMSLIASLEAALDAAARKSDRLRSSILATAFSGKLTPQNPNDEPSSVLLERIAAERTQFNGPRLGLANKAQLRPRKVTP